MGFFGFLIWFAIGALLGFIHWVALIVGGLASFWFAMDQDADDLDEFAKWGFVGYVSGAILMRLGMFVHWALFA